MAMQLPHQLLISIADSECEVVQWEGIQRTLTLRVTKDALPEVGLLHFSGVTFVHFPHALSLESIVAYTQATASSVREFPNLAERIDMDEAAIVFYDAWHQSHGCIIARTCHYQIVLQPVASTNAFDLAHPLPFAIEPLNLIAIWNVLNILTVSFDRLGSYELTHGESAAKDALHLFLQPALVGDIAHARFILARVLDEQAPALSVYLEETPDDQLGLRYWDGPQPTQ
jgi:hypothetical protein